jgi:UDPglucose 6-dehydrogenase
MDSRIGRQFLDASLGFGGSCFPKDLSAFIKISEQLGYRFNLLEEVLRINAQQMDRFVKKIAEDLDLGFIYKKINLSHKKSKSLSTEEIAREERYKFFKDAAATAKAGVIVTGHTHRPHLAYMEGALLFNPGAIAPDYYTFPGPTVGLLSIQDGVARAEVAPVGW